MDFNELISLTKRRGFVFQTGEIYTGLRAAYDYGPLGVLLKENIKNQWLKSMVQMRDDIVAVDSAVILPKKVWQASGHLDVFTDPLVECKSCHKRFREDELEEQSGKELTDLPCPACGLKDQWTEPKNFNLMLQTYLGVTQDDDAIHYLRPETAQGIFIQFANIMTAARKTPPFGIAQIGKAFRNEITPGNFIFRTREFEQMELEFFTPSDKSDDWQQYWIDTRLNWYIDLGINPDNLRLFEHPQEKLAHYSKRTVDIEYRFNFKGNLWGELEGIAHRGNYDLKVHQEHSGKDLQVFDQVNNTHYLPEVIEPSAGLTRSLLAFLIDAYTEDEAPNSKGEMEKRLVLKLDPRLAPYKIAVLPLSKKEELTKVAIPLLKELKNKYMVDYDVSGAIGRRYRRQDEIGTPYCITIDFDTLEDNAVTVRDRDTMQQERIAIDQLSNYFAQKLG